MTIEIETNPPGWKDPTNLGPMSEGTATKTHVSKTFEYPASLLE